jgi:hypothetical protein
MEVTYVSVYFSFLEESADDGSVDFYNAAALVRIQTVDTAARRHLEGPNRGADLQVEASVRIL